LEEYKERMEDLEHNEKSNDNRIGNIMSYKMSIENHLDERKLDTAHKEDAFRMKYERKTGIRIEKIILILSKFST
jgi:hypothetical protein